MARGATVGAKLPPSYRDALAQMSERVFQEASPYVLFLLLVEVPENTRMTVAEPVLTMAFHRVQGAGMADRTIPGALEALASIAKHSFLLSEFPDLKRAFWKRVLGSMMMYYNQKKYQGYFDNEDDMMVPPRVDDWMLERKSFPRIHINFQRRGKLSEAISNTILRFMGTPPLGFTVFERQFPRETKRFTNGCVAVGFQFIRCKLTLKCVQVLGKLLDAIAKMDQTRAVFKLTSLDLSHNTFDPPTLALVEEIVQKNTQVYRLSEIRLNEVIIKKSSAVAIKRLWSLAASVLIEASSGTLPTDDTHGQTQSVEQPPLRRFQVGLNNLELEHYAAICACLRYGCSLDALSLAQTMWKMSPRDRLQSWRWLAFGLFYPRCKRFDSLFQLREIDLGGVYALKSAIAAFIETLKNPAALAFEGNAVDTEASAKYGVRLSMVASQAVIFAKPENGAKPITILAQQTEFESIAESNGFVCVVTPGIGLGWVAEDFIVSSEEEPADEEQSTQYELLLNLLNGDNSTPEALGEFFEAIGKQLRLVNLSHNPPLGVALQAIVKSCVNMEHLILCDANLSDRDMAPLLEGLRGKLGDRLLSLNVNANSLEYDSALALPAIAEILSDQKRVPRLQELRIDVDGLRDPTREVFGKALRANKVLEYLELQDPLESDVEDDNPVKKRKFDDAHQNALLVASGDENDSGAPAKRRRISWKESMRNSLQMI
uniref:Uncharacterized protein n=1 Tax=Globisporangium ultimum (strain ATCC 200006 / CBS 805.95 / DAOM BR144) TaxID=431595 RepID=K3X7R8_GLOUD